MGDDQGALDRTDGTCGVVCARILTLDRWRWTLGEVKWVGHARRRLITWPALWVGAGFSIVNSRLRWRGRRGGQPVCSSTSGDGAAFLQDGSKRSAGWKFLKQASRDCRRFALLGPRFCSVSARIQEQGWACGTVQYRSVGVRSLG